MSKREEHSRNMLKPWTTLGTFDKLLLMLIFIVGCFLSGIAFFVWGNLNLTILSLLYYGLFVLLGLPLLMYAGRMWLEETFLAVRDGDKIHLSKELMDELGIDPAEEWYVSFHDGEMLDLYFYREEREGTYPLRDGEVTSKHLVDALGLEEGRYYCHGYGRACFSPAKEYASINRELYKEPQGTPLEVRKEEVELSMSQVVAIAFLFFLGVTLVIVGFCFSPFVGD